MGTRRHRDYIRENMWEYCQTESLTSRNERPLVKKVGERKFRERLGGTPSLVDMLEGVNGNRDHQGHEKDEII